MHNRRGASNKITLAATALMPLNKRTSALGVAAGLGSTARCVRSSAGVHVAARCANVTRRSTTALTVSSMSVAEKYHERGRRVATWADRVARLCERTLLCAVMRRGSEDQKQITRIAIRRHHHRPSRSQISLNSVARSFGGTTSRGTYKVAGELSVNAHKPRCSSITMSNISHIRRNRSAHLESE